MKATKKQIAMKTISIPVIFNNGITAIIVCGNEIYLNMPFQGSRIYYDHAFFGYMHIDEGRESEFFGKDYQPTFEEYQEKIKELNKVYYADKLKIDNPFFILKNIYIKKGLNSLKSILKDILFEDDFFTGKKNISISFKRPKYYRYERLEIGEKLNCPPLGATWQKYYSDNYWLTEAEELKGDKIFLA